MKNERLNIHNREERNEWCSLLNCSDAELMYCVSKVGTSYSSLESYLKMNKEILKIWIGNVK